MYKRRSAEKTEGFIFPIADSFNHDVVAKELKIQNSQIYCKQILSVWK